MRAIPPVSTYLEEYSVMPEVKPINNHQPLRFSLKPGYWPSLRSICNVRILTLSPGSAPEGPVSKHKPVEP